MKKYLALGLAALLAIGATIVPDSYDKLFCRMNGTTTTFVDSASPAKTITANGNATQLPIKFNKSAGFFNGTTDKIILQDSADWDLVGDFTIETFVNFTVLKSGSFVSQSYDGNNYWGFGYNNSTKKMTLLLAISGSAVITKSETWSPSVNTWYHVMVRRSGTSLSLYVDGAEIGTATTVVNTWSSLVAQLDVAYDYAAGGYGYIQGWLKELRISKVARTVAVPTTQYTSDANTVLLMHFDTPATSPLAPAIAFDGTGDFLTLADDAAWTPGTNFTAEAWVKFDSVGSATLLSQDGTSGNFGFDLYYSSANFKFQVSYDGTNVVAAAYSITPVANTWYHIAGVKNGNTLDVYVNGVKGGTSGDFTGKTAYGSSTKLALGCYEPEGTPKFLLNGSLREARISDTARYTTAFTPSQNGFTVDANTKLYIKGDENNGVTTFVDSETTPKTVTTAGDTKIKYTEDYRSCVFKDETGKFPYPQGSAKVDFFAIGSGVGYFDGASNLTVPDSDDWNLADGLFTAEMYVRHFSVADTAQGYIGQFTDGATSSGFAFVWNGGDGLAFYTNGSTTAIKYAAYSPLINTWTHLAVARTSGNVWNLFLNGTLVGTATTSVTIGNDTNTLKIGQGATYGGSDWASSASYYLLGLLDNIRISKGVARYTTTFNPPDDYSAPRIGKRKTNWFFFF